MGIFHISKEILFLPNRIHVSVTEGAKLKDNKN